MRERYELHHRWRFDAGDALQTCSQRTRLNSAAQRGHEHDDKLLADTRRLDLPTRIVDVVAVLDVHPPISQQLVQGRAADRVRIENQDAQIVHASRER
jgi:hypothetical protein